MANEESLRDRWNRVYRDSDKYQSALKSDAVSAVQRKADAAAAIKKAMARGDIKTAAALQQQAFDDNIRERTSGRAAGLDAFQNNRVNNYIKDARTAGQKQANDLRSHWNDAFSGDYLQGLENPDFANAHPYDNASRARVNPIEDTRARSPRGAGGDVWDATNPDPTGYLRQAAQDAENAQTDALRRERHLRAALPPDLAGVYGLNANGDPMTTGEMHDFLNATPEQQYATLWRAKMTKTPKTPGMRGEITKDGETTDYFAGGGAIPGSVGSSDFPALMRPLTSGTRPTASLVAPPAKKQDNTDYLSPLMQPFTPTY